MYGIAVRGIVCRDAGLSLNDVQCHLDVGNVS